MPQKTETTQDIENAHLLTMLIQQQVKIMFMEEIRALVKEEVKNIMTSKNGVMSIAEASAYIGITINSMHQLVNRKIIPYSENNGVYCFSRKELEKWVCSSVFKPYNKTK